MRILDLFSGIGGFSLGLERAGMKTVAFCEIDPKARQVLKKHWPDVPVYEDVSTLKGDQIGFVDVICGGFPCQDISTAGKGAGLEGARSGLWFEYRRLIKEIKPKYAIIENVSALRSRGLDRVLRSLAEIGYDAEWHCIPASAVGAPHQRDRIWIVAYPNLQHDQRWSESQQPTSISGKTWVESCRSSDEVADSRRQPTQVPAERRQSAVKIVERYTWWEIEPAVGRVVDGLSGRLDRLKQLGNAVVPQIPELIGRAIMEFENANS